MGRLSLCLPSVSPVGFLSKCHPSGSRRDVAQKRSVHQIRIRSALAVAINGPGGAHDRERGVAKFTVRATRQQTTKLLAWAEPFEQRTWAIESAGGLGYLLAQQLVDAGEHVVDVPPTLASRVRVLGTGRSDKNDPNDALSVAVAALRSPGLRSVEPANHREVLRL